jgi:hypothetical protein
MRREMPKEIVKRKRIPKSPDDKSLIEMKKQTAILSEIKEILDNTWRERKPA